MADFNQLPIKIETEHEQFVVQLDNSEYGDDELLSPNESGDFSEYHEYQDGGGKLRLKRRRKCGQCGPCQVKENCDKCHFCLRRDVLKQSCIYRKCLYLRKKMPRIRSDSLSSNNGLPRPAIQVPPSGHPTSPPVMCVSPNQGPIQSPNEINSCRLPQASPTFVPSSHGPSPPGPSPPGPNSQSSIPDSSRQQHLDPLRGFQADVRHMTPDNVRPFSQESMRSHSVERPRSIQGDVRPMSTEAVRSPPASQVSPAQSELLRQMPTGHYQARINHLQHLQNSQIPQLPKDQIGPRTLDQLGPRALEQLRHFGPEHYGAVQYGHPRHVIPPHGLPNPYGFPPGNIPPVSSTQMGLPQACRYSVPTQPAFHPHLAYNSNLRPHSFNSSTPSGTLMTPPFYPPPPPPVATSLASIPLGQYHPPPQGTFSAGGFGSPHTAIYPGGLYPPFRPPNEPFIYHARLPPPSSVFSEHASQMSQFRDQYLRKTEDEEEDCKKFDIFRLTKKNDAELMREKYAEESGRSSVESVIVSDKEQLNSKVPLPKSRVDDDLLEQINNISREDQCNVTITIDDLKMQAFIRSDGVNNLEIEIESPNMSPDSLPRSPNKEHSSNSSSSSDAQISSKSSLEKNIDENSDGSCKQTSKQTPCRKQTVTGTVCLKQDLGDEGIMQLELPGHKVQIEETLLEEQLVKQSENPEELLQFISNPSPPSSSSLFPETITIN
ncbi:arginine-glutamic acid dipeptide repeats protein-like [Haliotis cracherodii]|uniref:arginine-glutamic acid dipeptide repeats protein-like n=1 Tax=Haliotis cracherodii TaxID=6455 RepID=UPI0039E7FB28